MGLAPNWVWFIHALLPVQLYFSRFLYIFPYVIHSLSPPMFFLMTMTPSRNYLTMEAVEEKKNGKFKWTKCCFSRISMYLLTMTAAHSFVAFVCTIRQFISKPHNWMHRFICGASTFNSHSTLLEAALFKTVVPAPCCPFTRRENHSNSENIRFASSSASKFDFNFCLRS